MAIEPDAGTLTLKKMESDNTGIVTSSDVDPEVLDSDPDSTFDVEMHRLDDYIPPDQAIDLLKLDIEGMEVDGLPTLDLGRVEAMLVELHGFAYDEETRQSLVDFLGDRGSIQTVGREVLWTQ